MATDVKAVQTFLARLLGLILLEVFMAYANRWIVVLRNVVASAATLGFVGVAE